MPNSNRSKVYSLSGQIREETEAIRTGEVDQVLIELNNPNSPYHLVLIHGIGDSADVWREVCRQLGVRFKSYQEFRLPWSISVGEKITYEPKPQEILRQCWAKLPKGPKIVLAHSFGANAFVALSQEQVFSDVAACVLLSIYAKSCYEQFNWPMFVHYVNEFDRFIRMSIEARPKSKKLSDRSKNLIIEKTKQMYSPASWLQFYMVFSQSPGLKLDRMTMPTLMLGGAKDFSIEYEDAKYFASQLPDCEFHYFDQCGHFAMIESPMETAQAIHKFLISRKKTCLS